MAGGELMSLLFAKRSSLSDVGVPSRTYRRAGSVTVTNTNALTHSAVWACVRLRANLISSLPVDEFRRVNGVQREVPKDEFLARPGSLFIGGSRVSIMTWLYATQVDLDKCGNTFGLRTRNSLGETVRVDLLPVECVTVSVRSGQVQYRVDGQLVDTLSIWHEMQYVVSGLPVGLSPVAHAAMTIGQYLSAQQFGLDWFSGGAIPNARLKNTAKTLSPEQADTVKAKWLAAVRNGEPVVLGSDWDYDMISATANQSEFLATQDFSILDVCRFFDVPGDLIDAQTSTGSVTYANITQRNLQLLVMSLGPAILRREDALSTTRRVGNYVKLNTDAFMRMDPKTRMESLAIGVTTRSTTPNEIRELDNKPPLTPAQESEFARLFPTRAPDPTATKSEPVTLNVTSSPVEVDARSYPVVNEAETTVNVDATTTVEPGAVQTSHAIDARSTVNERELVIPPPEVSVTVEATEQRATTKRVETDPQGRITAIIEEPN